ncbi:MAG TPA: hypothetical protein VFS59_09430 [Gemmatimonadaceae bacterium]|nr:hypothetical protein [Gemmatimonadaceae bacterium]
MPTHAELATLQRSLRDSLVLSVYLEGRVPDPAAQHAWRVRLDHELETQRARLAAASHEERERFDACARVLERTLESDDAPVGGHGWVAFIEPDGVRHASSLLAPLPLLAWWGRGAFITPYLRALTEQRPVVVAVIDARKATVYSYHAGMLEVVASLHAHSHAAQPSHMGDAPRLGFHSGTRGVAGRDALQRTRRAGTGRMIAALVDRVTTVAGDDGWILLGGIPRVVAHAARPLAAAGARVLALPSLDVHASMARIAESARAGASTLRDAWASRQLDEIATRASAGGLGVLGREETARALALSSVRSLLVSERYQAEHPADVESAVRSALDQDASVDVVCRSAGRDLDAHGGIAALLRFRSAGDPSPSIGAGDLGAAATPPH